MLELFAIGFEMHKRVIDMHRQGVEAARDMGAAMARDVETALAARPAEAGMEAVTGWLRLWGVRG
ncbi:hypothetical protein [Sphingobium cloacae]|uniref:hypothetical protein n=1 Tax=Sphingobium cloacae TaxID=120107 RepID=UPI000835A2E6|nr:hypothetical protein [Sphingobium cloacae]